MAHGPAKRIRTGDRLFIILVNCYKFMEVRLTNHTLLKKAPMAHWMYVLPYLITLIFQWRFKK